MVSILVFGLLGGLSVCSIGVRAFPLCPPFFLTVFRLKSTTYDSKRWLIAAFVLHSLLHFALYFLGSIAHFAARQQRR
ncbi:hypothetical protein [Pararhizobium sp.]|uniref:hypothetical protein n=1 Tax=Pararhizobium sp. TaxID=1977563 RepID=UPI003D0BE0B1